MSNDMVKRGNWLVPADKVQEVTRHIFRDRADTSCKSQIGDYFMQKRFEDGEIERDMELENYDGPSYWGVDECVEYLEDHGIDMPEPNEDGGYDEDELLDLVRDNWEYPEVFEWWSMNVYFLAALEELGEVTMSIMDEYLWGRCTTGQAIYLDYVIEQACANWYEYYTDEFPFLERASKEE